jgi:hypothetical protein
MHVSTDPTFRLPPPARGDCGPAIYYGYCNQQRRYRMMDLNDYLANVQDGLSRMMSDVSSAYSAYQNAYQQMALGYGQAYPSVGHGPGCGCGCQSRAGGCGCGQRGCACHCECCVCDADILVHARCGETRRIPVTFENDARAERAVRLQLDKFTSSGGRDLTWNAQLSEAEFTLRGCDCRTVTVTVDVTCGGGTKDPNGRVTGAGTVDRCEVAYASLRAEGCLVRPVLLAVAVLPDDCGAFRRGCLCGCCH